MKFSNNYLFYAAHPALQKAMLASQRFAADKGEDFTISYPAEVAHGWDAGPGCPDNASTDQGDDSRQGLVTGLGLSDYGEPLLLAARGFLEKQIESISVSEAPLDWATAQDHLGNILAALGQGSTDSDILKASVQAFELALEHRSAEDTPAEWSASLFNQGVAWLALGQLERSPKTIKKAADAFTEALKQCSRKQAPHLWATTMFLLGMAFHAQGRLLNGHRAIEKAVVAYKNALAVWLREDDDVEPFFHAMAQNNRGAALQNLAEREDNPGRMEEAIRAYEHALSVWEEQLMPLPFAAKAMANLGHSRIALATLTKNVAMAQEAADEFELIVEIYHTACDADYLEQGKAHFKKAMDLVGMLA